MTFGFCAFCMREQKSSVMDPDVYMDLQNGLRLEQKQCSYKSRRPLNYPQPDTELNDVCLRDVCLVVFTKECSVVN